MLRLNELVRRFARDRRGTTAIEYGLIALLVEKGDHLPTNLQGRNVRVQVDTIQAFEVQHHVPIENLIDVPDRCHAAFPPTKLTKVHHCTSHQRPEGPLGGPRLASLAGR